MFRCLMNWLVRNSLVRKSSMSSNRSLTVFFSFLVGGVLSIGASGQPRISCAAQAWYRVPKSAPQNPHTTITEKKNRKDALMRSQNTNFDQTKTKLAVLPPNTMFANEPKTQRRALNAPGYVEVFKKTRAEERKGNSAYEALKDTGL